MRARADDPSGVALAISKGSNVNVGAITRDLIDLLIFLCHATR